MDQDLIYKRIGENIQKARLNAGLNQEELADKARLSRTSITNIEKGKQKIQIHTLYLIAERLQVPACDLLPNETPIEQDIKRELEKLDEAQREAVIEVIRKGAEGEQHG